MRSALCKRIRKPHTQKQFTSRINISNLSLATCLVPGSEEFVSVAIFSTVSFPLRTASWSHKCESWCVSLCPTSSACERQCRTGVDVQPNRDGSTQVFGKRLNSHRLCCCTVASAQFCFGGAGGDNALLPRPSLDEVRPVQDHAPADRLSCLPISCPIRVSKGAQSTWMSLSFQQTPKPWPSNEEPTDSLHVLQVLCARAKHP